MPRQSSLDSRGPFSIVPRADALMIGGTFRDTFDDHQPAAADRDEILKEVQTWIDADIYGIGLRNVNLANDQT